MATSKKLQKMAINTPDKMASGSLSKMLEEIFQAERSFKTLRRSTHPRIRSGGVQQTGNSTSITQTWILLNGS